MMITGDHRSPPPPLPPDWACVVAMKLSPGEDMGSLDDAQLRDRLKTTTVCAG